MTDRHNVLAPLSFNLEVSKAIDVNNVDVTAYDVAGAMDTADSVLFVTELDEAIGEWEHTLLCYHYFKSQVELARSTGAVPHLLDLSEDELWDHLAEDPIVHGSVSE